VSAAARMRLPAAVLCVLPLAAADPTLIALLPPEAPLVAGFDAARLGASGFGNRLLNRLPGGAGYRDLIARAGEVVFTTAGVADSGLVAVARGRFDGAALRERARARGETVAEYRGVPTIASNGGLMALLSDSIVALGDEGPVRELIARRESPATPDAAVLARARELAARHHGWLVLTTAPALALAEAVPNRTLSGALRGDLFQALESMSMGFRGGASALEVSGEAVAKTEKDAVLLAEALRFLTQMVPDLAGTDIRPEGSIVRFSGKAPAAFVERLLELSAPAGRPR
jgi:hypothetical protein